MLWLTFLLALPLLFVTSATTEQAVQIVSATDNEKGAKYHINSDALNILSGYHAPYKIISVIGQARKGKSTSLNSIISTLVGEAITPFNTSNNIDPCTQGMWMYIIPRCTCNSLHKDEVCTQSQSKNHMYCVDSDYSFIFVDIEGSDTAKNNIALHYASIVTLLSSKVFLFIHGSLYAHDIDHIDNIETFRRAMNKQNLQIPFNDLDLGIIIREPLGEWEKGELQPKINQLFQEYSGINLQHDSDLLNHELPVFAVDHIENKYNYKKTTQHLADYIVPETNYKKSKNKLRFELLDSRYIIQFMHQIIEEMNKHQDLNAMCIGCIFSKIIDWNQWGKWSECSKQCGGGVEKRIRTCNTGKDRDCMKFRHGSWFEERICNEFDCDLLKWGEWHPWSECSAKCEGGTQERFRECKIGNNKHCENVRGGTTTEKRECNKHSCWSLCGLFNVLC